jgi:hypothetical protein
MWTILTHQQRYVRMVINLHSLRAFVVLSVLPGLRVSRGAQRDSDCVWYGVRFRTKVLREDVLKEAQWPTEPQDLGGYAHPAVSPLVPELLLNKITLAQL